METSSQTLPPILAWLLPVGFVVIFVTIWLVASTLVRVISGWGQLEKRYPDRDEPATIVIANQTAMMRGVSYKNVLTLSATTSGLRVSMWKIFAPFSKPFLVPWSEIDAEPVSVFLQPMSRLQLGRAPISRMTIDRSTWERLSAEVKGLATPESKRLTTSELRQSLLLQWLLFTAAIAGLFYLISWLASDAPRALMFAPVGFVALIFGIAQIFRYFRQARLLKD